MRDSIGCSLHGAWRPEAFAHHRETFAQVATGLRIAQLVQNLLRHAFRRNFLLNQLRHDAPPSDEIHHSEKFCPHQGLSKCSRQRRHSVDYHHRRIEQRRLNLEQRIPLRREGTPEQVADVILMLVQNDYITGETITIDGGLTMRIA